MGYTGIIASSFVGRTTEDRTWDVSLADTVRQANGSAAALNGAVATWTPSTGSADADTLWTAYGPSATLVDVPSTQGAGAVRRAIHSTVGNLLHMPGTLPMLNVTWLVAFRWMGAPGSFAHVFIKFSQAAGMPQGTWMFLRKQSGNDMWIHGNTAGGGIAGTAYNAATDLGALRVAVCRIKRTTATRTDVTVRLTHPTTLTRYVAGILKEDTVHPWSLGGMERSVVNGIPQSAENSDIAVHEVRLYGTVLRDAELTAASDALMSKWS
jgi:hypothetical protein